MPSPEKTLSTSSPLEPGTLDTNTGRTEEAVELNPGSCPNEGLSQRSQARGTSVAAGFPDEQEVGK